MEPFATPEIYACGLGAVHIIGGGACCLVWYRNSAVVEAPGTMCRRVTGSVIIPVGSIPDAMQQLIDATTDEAVKNLNVLRLR